MPETLSQYKIEKISATTGKWFIKRYHYSKTCHNGPMTWGLFRHTHHTHTHTGKEIVGVIAFATPISERVRAQVFGAEHVNRITELHRLVILDDTPKNTESWFISRALKALHEYRPNLWAVLSFADATEGHLGTIYQASNALYLGTTEPRKFYRDEQGVLRHPRYNGVNTTHKEAKSFGWIIENRDSKYRYLFLLGSKRFRRKLNTKVLLQTYDYPKEIN